MSIEVQGKRGLVPLKISLGVLAGGWGAGGLVRSSHGPAVGFISLAHA